MTGKSLVSGAVVGSVVWAMATVFAADGEGPAGQAGQQNQPPHQGPPTPEHVFAQMDSDGDGQVTMQEFAAHHENHPPRQGPHHGPPRRPRPEADDHRGGDRQPREARGRRPARPPRHPGPVSRRRPGADHNHGGPEHGDRGPMRIGACPHCEAAGAAIKSARPQETRRRPPRGRGPQGPKPRHGDHPRDCPSEGCEHEKAEKSATESETYSPGEPSEKAV